MMARSRPPLALARVEGREALLLRLVEAYPDELAGWPARCAPCRPALGGASCYLRLHTGSTAELAAPGKTPERLRVLAGPGHHHPAEASVVPPTPPVRVVLVAPVVAAAVVVALVDGVVRS